MKNEKDNSTPRPWATDIEVKTFDGKVLDAVIYVNHGSGKGGEICTFRQAPDDGLDNRSEEQIANANLIVKAVNEHAKLVACVENLRLAICSHNQKQSSQLDFVQGADIHAADKILTSLRNQ